MGACYAWRVGGVVRASVASRTAVLTASPKVDLGPLSRSAASVGHGRGGGRVSRRSIRRWACAAVLAIVPLGCSNGGDSEDVADPTTTTLAGEAAPGEWARVGPAATTEPADLEAYEAAREDVGAVADQIPQGEGVGDCVAATAAGDDGLRAALEAAGAGDPGSLDLVLEAAAVCSQAAVAAPAFAEEQQRASGGTLTEGELVCLRDGYAALDPEVVQQAAAEAVAPSAGERDATQEIERLVEDCGV